MNEEIDETKAKQLEEEFKEFLKVKDNISAQAHELLSQIFGQAITDTHVTYAGTDPKVRMEIHHDNGTKWYSWYTSSDILSYAVVGACKGLFKTDEVIQYMIIANAFNEDFDLALSFIEVVNSAIDIIHKASDNWNICIK